MMKKHRYFIHCATFAVLIAGGLAISSDSANAQQASDESAAKVIEEVVAVEAPIKRERARPGGMTVEVIELKRQVSFADLDLSKHSDVAELEERIETTAKDSCEKLEEMYPLSRNPSRAANIRRCTKDAIAGSAEELQAAVAAAQ